MSLRRCVVLAGALATVVAASSAMPAPGSGRAAPGGQIVFVSNRATAASAGRVHLYRAIYRVGVGGAGLRQLTSGPFDSADTAWRPQPPPQS
jgi:hypothetical protein